MNSIRNIFVGVIGFVGMLSTVTASPAGANPVGAYGVQPVAQLTDQSKQEAIYLANMLGQKVTLPYEMYQQLNTASISGTSFSEEQLEKLLKNVLELIVPITPETQELRSRIAQVQHLLAKKLQSYHVTGVSLAIDPNGAFFVDNQDPEFTVAYKDGKGGLKTRRYAASIDSIGFKVEFAVNIDLIFFTNTAVNFYDSEKVIELGTGFETGFWPISEAVRYATREPDLAHLGEYLPASPSVQAFQWLCNFLAFTYVPFKNMPGGLVILHGKIGICGPDISVVTGGTLTPLA